MTDARPDLRRPGASRADADEVSPAPRWRAAVDVAAEQGLMPHPAARWPRSPTRRKRSRRTDRGSIGSSHGVTPSEPVESDRRMSDACSCAGRADRPPARAPSADLAQPGWGSLAEALETVDNDMDQRVSLSRPWEWRDLERAVAFYGALGWAAGQRLARPGRGVLPERRHGVRAVGSRGARADSGTGVGHRAPSTSHYNVGSPDAVDDGAREARDAGARILRDGRGDVLGRIFGGVPRPRRSPVGNRTQSGLADRC